MADLVRTWLNEPRADNPPHRVWRDWLLIGVLAVALTVETVLRNDINLPFITIPMVAAMGLALALRRTFPMKTFAFVFGGIIVFDVLSVLAGFGQLNVYSASLLLILMYSLFRWGSGTEMAIGTVLGFILFVLANIVDYTGIGDLITGLIILEFPAALGLATRYLRRSREQAREQLRRAERETLARELHDTVAHHVSAIVIQAQAGQFVAESGSLEGATKSLATIEEEAARALTEMRSIVGVLREVDAPAAMAPQSSVADIRSLASTADSPTIDVTVADDLTTLGGAVGAALYRIAQESVTNARRHAQNATTIKIRLDLSSDTGETGPASQIRLSVIDDGDTPNGGRVEGFGLIGMKERAILLGGTLEAGPGPTTGWQVKASLPYPRAKKTEIRDDSSSHR